jgi:hypothetical protein
MLSIAGITANDPIIERVRDPEGNYTFGWTIQWRAPHSDDRPPAFVQLLGENPRVRRLEFRTR